MAGLKVWTNDLREKAIVLWADHSAQQISNILIGEGHHFTRNSVIGLLDRAGVTFKDKSEAGRKSSRGRVWSGVKSAPKTRSGEHHVITRIAAPKIKPVNYKLRCVEMDEMSLKLSTVDLPSNGCEYIKGFDHLHCGHPKMKGGSSYCVPHHHLTRGNGTPSERAATRVAA